MAQSDNQAEAAQIEFDLENVEILDDASQPIVDVAVDGQTAVEAKPDEITELRKQLEEANRLRADAESRANNLHAEKSVSESRLTAEVTNRFAAQEQAIDVRANAAKQAITTIKTEMVRAQAEQRFEDFADLQQQMAEAVNEGRAATWEKADIGRRKVQAAAEIEASATRSRDPMEQFLANIPGDRSRQWLRDHQDILRKSASSASEAKRLYGYAQIAEANGNAPDSPGYFDSIEQQFGLKETPAAVTEQTTQAKTAPKAPGQTAAAAPSNRAAAQNAPGTRRVLLDDVVRKLTPSDRANAKISFPDKAADEAEKLYAQGIVISKQREPGFRPDIRL